MDVTFHDEEFIRKHMVNVEQFAAEPFNIGESGWPANDIELFNRASSVEEMEAIARKLDLMRSSSDVDITKLSIQEQFDMIKPRNLQTPAECERFVNWLTSRSIRAAQESGLLDNSDTNNDDENNGVNASAEANSVD